MHMTDISQSDDRKIEMADKKQKRKTSAETKEGLHSVYTWTRQLSFRAAPQQLKSVYTGCDKATIENHLKFVSMHHK